MASKNARHQHSHTIHRSSSDKSLKVTVLGNSRNILGCYRVQTAPSSLLQHVRKDLSIFTFQPSLTSRHGGGEMRMWLTLSKVRPIHSWVSRTSHCTTHSSETDLSKTIFKNCATSTTGHWWALAHAAAVLASFSTMMSVRLPHALVA